MDYPINRPIDNSTMENGYYRTTEANWAAINPTTNFQFLKKQFFRIEGPSDLKVTIEDANVTMDSPAPGIIRLRYLDIDLDTADSFINFQFKTASNYCSITVY